MGASKSEVPYDPDSRMVQCVPAFTSGPKRDRRCHNIKARFQAASWEGLQDGSRRPYRLARQIPTVQKQALREARSELEAAAPLAAQGDDCARTAACMTDLTIAATMNGFPPSGVV